jgi:hypothetical protein
MLITSSLAVESQREDVVNCRLCCLVEAMESMGYHIRQSFIRCTFPSSVRAALSHELFLLAIPTCWPYCVVSPSTDLTTHASSQCACHLQRLIPHPSQGRYPL